MTQAEKFELLDRAEAALAEALYPHVARLLDSGEKQSHKQPNKETQQCN